MATRELDVPVEQWLTGRPTRSDGVTSLSCASPGLTQHATASTSVHAPRRVGAARAVGVLEPVSVLDIRTGRTRSR